MKRFFKKLTLFYRYSVWGFVTFILELALLYAFTAWYPLPYFFSVPLAFGIAATVQYAACHWWVFKKSGRLMRVEYEYFLGIRIVGVLLALLLVVLFVQIGGFNVYAARILSAVFTGMFNFYLNARFNFRAHPF